MINILQQNTGSINLSGQTDAEQESNVGDVKLKSAVKTAIQNLKNSVSQQIDKVKQTISDQRSSPPNGLEKRFFAVRRNILGTLPATDLLKGAGLHEMTKKGAPTTCYDLAAYSLVQTGQLPKRTFEQWQMGLDNQTEGANNFRVNTYLLVDPREDQRITDPQNLPANSLIGIYRRFRPNEKTAAKNELEGGWVLNHIVRTTEEGGRDVIGGNNGESKGTIPSWSRNNLRNMYDWRGEDEGIVRSNSRTGEQVEIKTQIYQGEDLPAERTFGKDGRQDLVAFVAPIDRVVERMKRAYPGT